MPKRSEKRDQALAEYIARKSTGADVNLRELAEDLGTSYQNVRNWKKQDDWDTKLPKRKRGGQPGNKNSKGHQNAKGSHKGAPPRNKNAEKDGAYSRVYFDELSPAEEQIVNSIESSSEEMLLHELRVMRIRENRIMVQIAEYEKEPEDTLHLSSLLDMHGAQEMGMYSSDTAFSRVLKLQEALYKVQGRIAKIVDSLRAIEENRVRVQLEREKLDIMRMRATGVFEFPDDEEAEESDEETVHSQGSGTVAKPD